MCSDYSDNILSTCTWRIKAHWYCTTVVAESNDCQYGMVSTIPQNLALLVVYLFHFVSCFAKTVSIWLQFIWTAWFWAKFLTRWTSRGIIGIGMSDWRLRHATLCTWACSYYDIRPAQLSSSLYHPETMASKEEVYMLKTTRVPFA